MGLHFLTLVSAVLVFSLNFAEKVFDFKSATKMKRLVVIAGWCLFLVSIIFCGIGLVLNSLAGGDAVYHQQNYQKLAQLSYQLIVVAGCAFIGGLIFIILSAVLSGVRVGKGNILTTIQSPEEAVD